MKKSIFLVTLLGAIVIASAQTPAKLATAFKKFETDPQLSHALVSLYVINAKTGKVIIDKNSKMGMAPASTQKIITSATAFELLGKDYRYKTSFYNAKRIKWPGVNDLLVIGSGDPTLGSWRYNNTTEDVILKNIYDNIRAKNIKTFTGEIVINNFENESIPDGYNWQDIGNYYGAGHYHFSWHENQYDIAFKTANEGLSEIVNIKPAVPAIEFINQVIAGKKGSGDNAYVYFVPGKNEIVLKGTVPPAQSSFTISGAVPDPSMLFADQLQKYLLKENESVTIVNGFPEKRISITESSTEFLRAYQLDTIYNHYSPPLDSVIYWFLKKSINLYGEALIKTMALEKKGKSNIDDGVELVKDFWRQKNIDPDELNLYDGSGLSPSNRVTTHAQVEVLKYAKKRNWFSYYYNAFPEYNKMKMKSGTIADVKGFAGYHTAKDGTEYIFSFLVNNYNGSSGTLVQKMYKVLDELK